ncbi:hypothetical protein U9M48_030119 [Paspalum notatum var. saurae]|uniref:Uncharacterized protein n=1 Tax=Paspalum notatum var. saurae TaxID=547442 RepID=A0AAQ3U0C6_PASNO
MAEVLATMVVGPLLSMVKDKASNYLLDQYNVMEGMEEQHKLLKRKLPAVLDVIADAEEQAAKHREGAKAWLEEVRKVAHKANDVLDEFKYEALRRKAGKEGQYKELGMDVIKLFPSHNRFVFRCRMANKLRQILQELDVLITEMNIFRFKFKPQPPMSLKWRHTDPYISAQSVDIASKSRAKEKQEIVDQLLHQGGSAVLTVLPIVGMGGMGKTTIAQLVYNDSALQKHFQVRLSVCVSEHFDVDSLVQRIVEAAKENGCKVEGNSSLDKLRSVVSGKRYLLILDDVWNRDTGKWEKLKFYLAQGGNGSSVLTTTRDRKVAEIMGTIEAHDIEGLGKNFIKEIIKRRAFSSQTERPELLRMLDGIVQRCSGSPLAATALGSVLCTKNTLQEWEDILNKNTICDEENGIIPILKLSYNCLPPHMRQCFAFCAMFPKDYEIDVDMLIRLWMANSFIPEQHGACLEFTGKEIFNELTQRSFFQEVKQVTNRNVNYSITTCKIHDLMHDVAQDSMGKECAAIDRELSQSEDFPFSARHLFLSVDIPETALKASLEKGPSSIQTLISEENGVQHLSKYSCVRALKIPQCSFRELKYLHHLRYLDLSRSDDIEALPEDMTILYHLQTLNVSHCQRLRRLPNAMKNMTALRHLYTHGCLILESMPAKLGHLTCLQTLSWFVAAGTTVSSCSSNMGELGKLLDLGGQLELRQLENVGRAEAKAASIGKKKRLEELALTWTDGHGSEANREVLEVLEPHDGLKAMRIKSYGSSAIPAWILKLQGMVKLELRGCRNLKKLPALWKLSALQFLRLESLENLHCLFSGGTPSKFQKLKSMVLLEMPNLKTWWEDTDEVQGDQEPIFPEVEILVIDGCEKLRALPKASATTEDQCRSAFPSLREMTLHGLDMLHRWEEADQGSTGGDEQVTFPKLEQLDIQNCPELSTCPKAPILSELSVGRSGEAFAVKLASRYITSLSRMDVWGNDEENNWIELLPARDNEEERDQAAAVAVASSSSSPLAALELRGCSDLFFSGRVHWPDFGPVLDSWAQFGTFGALNTPSDPIALALLWTCFGQLVELTIDSCHGLVYWPEKAFQGLVALRTLQIGECRKLTGEQQQSAPVLLEGTGGGPLPPHLESLDIIGCNSLVVVPSLPASLKRLSISGCDGLQGRWSMVFVGQLDTLPSLTVAPAAGSSTSSSAGNRRLSVPPCLESLEIASCHGLSEVVNLPPSMKTLVVHFCASLGSLSASGGELPLLEGLTIFRCKSLVEFPNMLLPSLKTLQIWHCDDLKGSVVFFSQQHEEEEEETMNNLVGGEGGVAIGTSSKSSTTIAAAAAAGSSNNCPSSSSAALKSNDVSSSPNDYHRLFVPCLESLGIQSCDGLSEVAILAPSIKTLTISHCHNLASLSLRDQLSPSSLEELRIFSCERLASLPSPTGPHQEAYSSLRVLKIKGCPRIKQLPPSLLQRLDDLEEKSLDPHLVGGSTMTRFMRKLVPSRLRSGNLCITSTRSYRCPPTPYEERKPQRRESQRQESEEIQERGSWSRNPAFDETKQPRIMEDGEAERLIADIRQ